jgi:hypothetical protein
MKDLLQGLPISQISTKESADMGQDGNYFLGCVVRVCPWQGDELPLLKDHGHFRKNPMPEIDAMGKIFPGGQNQILQGQQPSIDIDPAAAPMAQKFFFNPVGKQLDIGQPVTLYQLPKRDKTPLQGITHLACVIRSMLKVQLPTLIIKGAKFPHQKVAGLGIKILFAFFLIVTENKGDKQFCR